jgi:ADP-dependent NAD(P)H-hydrate dehydratase / NAD(P)H-hydrate epimerase
MQLLSADHIRAWDAHTIAHTPIASIDLMERASMVFTNWFSMFYEQSRPIVIACGTGNNGGDGLVIARLLTHLGYRVQVFILKISRSETDDFKTNLERLPKRSDILRGGISTENSDALADFYQSLTAETVLIDAILGSGLTRPVTGFWATVFEKTNSLHVETVAVDIPSGLFADQHTPTGVAVLCADRVLSFEIPKLAFFMPENQRFVGDFDFKSIGLLPDFLEKYPPQYFYVQKPFVQKFIKKRGKFDHKGTFGHALLMVGSAGMAGAAVLAARACMRSGVGVLTVQTPSVNQLVLQLALPEAIVAADVDAETLTELPNFEKYAAVGIGCGISKAALTADLLHQVLQSSNRPLVLDADALNLIAAHPDWLNLIPKGSILTPHPKEFERLFGKASNDFDRLNILKTQSKRLKINILLKGAHSIVANTEGVCFINSTGNAGMATAGSGDVLTGIITGLLAQGYAPTDAAVLGVYWHGLAGDVAAGKMGQAALMASDIVENLGAADKLMRVV